MATYSSIKQAVATAANVARVVATNYDSIGSLPTSGNVLGEQALVIGDSSTDRLYIWEGSAWYQVALIQNSPTFTTSPDAAYELATDGVTTTVITLAATDPEGFPITFSATTNVGFDSIASVSQDSSVFTVTPFSQDSAGVSRSGTITFKASDGISVASAISTFTITFSVENSNYTSMLLKASGNNGTNTALNDASSFNRTITVGGDISAQAFTPHHPGGYSAYFDGSGDYLVVPDGDHFDFSGGSNYTLEAWIYPTTVAGSTWRVIANNGSAGQYSPIYFAVVGDKLHFLGSHNGSSYTIDTRSDIGSGGISTISANEWTHVAAVWDQTDYKFFVNGALKSTIAKSGDPMDPVRALGIGARQDGNEPFTGYITDLRLIKGTALYTTSFTPPTERLTAITNTELLVCHLPYLADGSSNDHAVTFAGNVAIKRFAPYDHAPYNASSHGASIYNDGTGDYMSVAADTTHLTMSGDFTIDFWYYPRAAKTNGLVYGKWANNSDGWAIFVTPNWSSGNFGYVSFYYGNYGSNESTTNLRSTVVTLNQWHYIRITRSSGTMYMSVNGKVGTRTNYASGITFTDNRTFNADTAIGICGNSIGYTVGDAFVSDLRVINGTALTTGNFTPPTSPATAVTNTKLLTCNDAPNIFNSTGVHTLPVKLFGDAKSSTSQNKNASSGMFFDGSGDYITSEFPALDTDDFTIEFWIRPDTINSNFKALMDTRTSNTNNPLVWIRNNNVLYLYSASGERIVGTTYLTTDTWYHVALVRNNGVSQLFLNGVQESSDYVDTNNYTESTLFLGQRYTGTAYNYNGYMEDFRITKGLSRYPFIKAKETLTAISGTSFLTAHAATITDGSSNSISITSQGDPTVSNFAPASGMKSILFDGNDYLEMADGDYKTFGSDDFTIEAWVYPTSVGSGFGNYIWGDTASSGATNTSSTAVLYNSSGKFGAYITVAGPTILDMSASSLTTPVNNWYHLALVRNGNTFSLFVDGVLSNSATNSNAVLDSSQILTVGRTGAYGGLNFVGYVSNYRIVKGTALYTNSFTPPTAELKA